MALGLEMSDLNAFEPMESFKIWPKQMFEPPMDEFRTPSEILKLKRGKLDVHAYAQHIRLLASIITASPVHTHTLITVFMKGLADRTVRNHLFCL